MKKSSLLGKGLIRILVILLMTFLSLSITKSIGWSADGLFPDAGSVSDSHIKKQMEKIDPTVVRSRWVKVDFDQLVGESSPEGAETILLNLFDDVSLIAVKDRLERRSMTRYTWFGKIVGVKLGQVILVVEDGVMAGDIMVNGQLYQVRTGGEGIHMVREIDQSRFPDEAPPIPIVTPPDSLKPSSLYFPLDDGSTIDILVVYTSAAASDSSNIASEIQLAIDGTNQSYINSGINQRVQLVHSAQIDYTETANSSTDLSRLQNPSDGYMDNVHTLRDQYCADIVSLWVKDMESSNCGIGYLMTTVSTDFASYAFYVVKRSCATGNFSFAHEMGHNMGAHHDRYATSENGAYTYSHGYVYTPDRWRTIMAYNSECVAQGFNCMRIQYWSNPDVNYGGVPMGVSSTSPNSADNRLTLNNTASTVANFRASCTSPCPTPGTPSNPSPANGATGVSNNPTLSWSACVNTDSYDVYFGTSSSPPYVGNTPSTSYSPSGLSYSTPYYLQIVAKNNCGNSTSGSIWSFTTQTSALLPNLTPYQPSGWSDKIVVSNTTGTHTDSSPLYPTDTLYVDWAVINNGAAATSMTFYTKLYVDGVEKNTWSTNPLEVNYYTYVTDYSIGPLSAGTHAIKIVADATGVISEGNESDNEYSKTITVSSIPSCPNLYFWDGDGYVFGRSLFPGAFQPEREYRDYISLSHLVSKEGKYYLQIIEEEKEISFIDMVYLIVNDFSSNGDADSLPNRKPMSESQGCEFIPKNLDENDAGSGRSILRQVKLFPSAAIHSVLGNVRNRLLLPDDKYVRMDQGDLITLTFPYIPDISVEGTTREFLFVAEGYYTLPEE